MRKPILYFAGMALWSFNFSGIIEERLTVKTAPPMYATQPQVHREIRKNGLQPFMNAMGHYESGNNYRIVNQTGHLGKYQFGIKTLRSLDIHVSAREFLSSPTLQDIAMLRLMRRNQQILWPVIRQYDGQQYNGILITQSGILAAAHLVGPGAVLSAFKSDSTSLHGLRDGNGTTAAMYMSLFAGYRIRLQGNRI